MLPHKDANRHGAADVQELWLPPRTHQVLGPELSSWCGGLKGYEGSWEDGDGITPGCLHKGDA